MLPALTLDEGSAALFKGWLHRRAPTQGPFSMSGTSSFVACIALSIAVYLLRQSRPKGVELPPGPRGKWLVGNLVDFFEGYQWRKFSSWSKIFGMSALTLTSANLSTRSPTGDVICLTVLGRPIIILNKFEDARELMDKRGALYSDRPRMTYINEMSVYPLLPNSNHAECLIG